MTKYYFLGIGGIGMSAIARYFNCKGYKVGGYDRVCSQLCLDLQKEGIDIHYTDLKDNIPTEFTDPHEAELVATEALALVSMHLNKGLSPFEKARKNMDKTNEVLEKLNLK